MANEQKYNVEDIARMISEDPDIIIPESTTAVPTKPNTKPGTPSTPGKKPGKEPNKNPLSPKTNPQTPARAVVGETLKKKVINPLKEAYESNVPRPVRDIFQNPSSRTKFGFSDVSLVKKHGPKLAKEAYESSRDALFQMMPELASMQPQQRFQHLMSVSMRALQGMMRLEVPHKEELERLAIEVVSSIYSIPEEYKHKLRAFLQRPNRQTKQEIENEEAEENQEQEETETPAIESEPSEVQAADTGDVQSQIHKRYYMNLLSQGAAIHNMYSAHFQDMILDKVREISPELADFYSKFGRGSAHLYWMYDISMMLNASLPGAMGTAEVTSGGSVVAQGSVLPVLIQELVKGVVMLISNHQFESMSPDDASKVISAADTLHDEFPQIMIGPKIWSVILKIVPKEYKSRLMEMLMHLAKAHPKEVEVIFDQIGDAIANRHDLNDCPAVGTLRDFFDRYMKNEEHDVAGEWEDPEPEDDFYSGDDEDDDSEDWKNA